MTDQQSWYAVAPTCNGYCLRLQAGLNEINLFNPVFDFFRYISNIIKQKNLSLCEFYLIMSLNKCNYIPEPFHLRTLTFISLYVDNKNINQM